MGWKERRMEWKDGAGCPVLLTFDLDLDELWHSFTRDGRGRFDTPTTFSMAEYGYEVGVPRILDLLDAYDIPGGFFIPGRVAEKHPEMVQDIHDRGHEIGNHGYYHNTQTRGDGESVDEVGEGLIRGNEVIESIVGEVPRGIRVPSSDITVELEEKIIEIGFEYQSNLKGNDIPYLIRTDAGSLVELPFHSSTVDTPYFFYNVSPSIKPTMSSPSKVLDIWTTEFDFSYECGLLANYVMHPSMISRPHRMLMLEKLIQHMDRRDTWFARPIDVVEYVETSDQELHVSDILEAAPLDD